MCKIDIKGEMVGRGPLAHWKIFTDLFWNGSAGVKAIWLTS